MKAIERYFGSFRKSRRKTMAALASGLLMAGRLGLASIARGMNDFTTVRHRIKRAWRFASNKRIRTRKASGCLVDWLLRASRGRPVVALDWTDISRRRVMLLAAVYHKSARVQANLVVAHAEPAPEPWYLVTNLQRATAAVKAYRRRCWIEEHFRDAKGNMGLDRLRIK